jgi:hypothetical protein
MGHETITKDYAGDERIKRKYSTYLKDAKRHREPIVDVSWKTLNRSKAYALRSRIYLPSRILQFAGKIIV